MKAVKLKPSTHVHSGLVYRVYQNQGQGPIIVELNPITLGVKSLDRFYAAILPCCTLMLSGMHEFKIFQHYGDSSAAGL